MLTSASRSDANKHNIVSALEPVYLFLYPSGDCAQLQRSKLVVNTRSNRKWYSGSYFCPRTHRVRMHVYNLRKNSLKNPQKKVSICASSNVYMRMNMFSFIFLWFDTVMLIVSLQYYWHMCYALFQLYNVIFSSIKFSQIQQPVCSLEGMYCQAGCRAEE